MVASRSVAQAKTKLRPKNEAPQERERVTVYVSRRVALRLRLAAARRNETLSDIVDEVLDRALPEDK